MALAVMTSLAARVRADDETLKSSVVRIEVDKLVTRQTPAGGVRTKQETYVGSGFWVAGTNRIVTCAHVVEGAQRVSVQRWGAPRLPTPWSTPQSPLTLCLYDTKHDLAVIQVPEIGVGLPLSSGASVTPGAITSVGHTDAVPWRIDDGRRTQQYTARDIGVDLDGDVLLCGVIFGPGSSGGIVVAQDRIIGMIEGGKEGGRNGTRIAIPASTIKQALGSIGEQSCGRPLIATNATIVANENTFADLIRKGESRPEEQFPASYWGEAAFGVIVGADSFDNAVPALRLELLRASTESRSWLLRLEAARRQIDRTVSGGGQEATDSAEMERFSLTAGPRIRLKEFGPVALFSAAAVGLAHDRITHDYTFTKAPIFAPQKYERSVTGILGELSVDADVQIALNMRLGLSTQAWQGSGGIGNGVTNHVGLRLGVGGHAR